MFCDIIRLQKHIRHYLPHQQKQRRNLQTGIHKDSHINLSWFCWSYNSRASRTWSPLIQNIGNFSLTTFVVTVNRCLLHSGLYLFIYFFQNDTAPNNRNCTSLWHSFFIQIERAAVYTAQNHADCLRGMAAGRSRNRVEHQYSRERLIYYVGIRGKKQKKKQHAHRTCFS